MNTRDIMTDASRKEALGLFLGMLGSQTENKVVLDSLLKEIQDQQNAIAAALAEAADYKAKGESLCQQNGTLLVRNGELEREVAAHKAEAERLRDVMQQAKGQLDNMKHGIARSMLISALDSAPASPLELECERLRGLLQHFVSSRRVKHCGNTLIGYEAYWDANNPIHQALVNAAYPPAATPTAKVAEIIASQTDMPAEFAKVIDDNFFDLTGPDATPTAKGTES